MTSHDELVAASLNALVDPLLILGSEAVIGFFFLILIRSTLILQIIIGLRDSHDELVAASINALANLMLIRSRDWVLFFLLQFEILEFYR